MPQNQRKSIIRILIDNNAASALKAIGDRRGMTQVSLASRLVKWFARQDSAIQSRILDQFQRDGFQLTASELLKRMAARADGTGDGVLKCAARMKATRRQ